MPRILTWQRPLAAPCAPGATTDGLLSDSVTVIVQTRDGFLWVGTTAGLVWFDGVKFTEVKLEATRPRTVRSSSRPCAKTATAICGSAPSRTGCFNWLPMADCAALYHGSRGLLDDNVTSLAPDNRGQVWIGGRSGLNLWTGQNFKSFTKRDGLSDDFVSGVNVARSGVVWITTRIGMCRFMDGHITPHIRLPEPRARAAVPSTWAPTKTGGEICGLSATPT